ncbi:SIMPL domain-containing protein [Sphingobacteriaceae bacterium WQ 2009]|uniref:SIMPL domain-containing protein n=2 Tax=Rhinopithecimicrobium faecis TaxID=2820698 RepID=A0A8T4HDF9_9SPHI|nr:SIMPL domain-containing protein [Sphingobacteriaceae bacterium WQ 2009]
MNMKKLILGIGVGMLLLANSSVSMAQQAIENLRKISTKGTAESEVTPDIIYLSISLREYFADGNAKKKVTIETLEEQLQAGALKAGIDKKNFTIENLWSYQSQSSRKKDPTIMQSRQYRIKVTDLSKINFLFDAVNPEGVQNTSIAEYQYSGEKELQKTLKIQAMKDAFTNATNLAEAINQKVGKAILISDSPIPVVFASYSTRSNNMMMMSKASGADVAVEPKLVDLDIKPMKITTEIDVVFELL